MNYYRSRIPKGQKPIPTKNVFKKKIDNVTREEVYRVRNVVKGFNVVHTLRLRLDPILMSSDRRDVSFLKGSVVLLEEADQQRLHQQADELVEAYWTIRHGQKW